MRSRAPLRLGLAGGGTDVSPYSDIYGGAVLNATITMYAYASVEPRSDGKIILHSVNQGTSLETSSKEIVNSDDATFVLHKGVCKRIASEFVKSDLSFQLSTYVDAHPGSGLGTSSTLVVAMVGAFVEWLGLPLGDYDIARLAYEIERIDLNMAGGKQDQYAATFGGFNFMEFHTQNDKVIVNPLRIRQEYIYELEFNTVLYQTGTSRLSSKIIEDQSRNVIRNNQIAIEAMHHLKEQAILMKEAILKGQLREIGPILDYGWNRKKRMADSISNPTIDEIYDTAIKAGSTGGKISGAGGGGYMMFYCPGNTRYQVIEALHKNFGGEFRRFQFAKHGLTSWHTVR
jgi:D-glycero-alpha-D-manno-heptose-7-phosphate kinase